MIHRTGVLHAACQDGSVEQINFWLSDVSIYDLVTQWLAEEFRYNKFAFTPYSSSAAWSEQFGDTTPISQFINPQTFLSHVMQTRQQRNSATAQQMDVDQQETENTGADGANLFSPPNVRRNATNPAGINVTPATAQRRPAPGGLSAILQALFPGGTTNQTVPEQPDPQGIPPPGGAPPAVPPVPEIPPDQQQPPSITDLLLQLLQQQQQAAPPPQAPPPAVDPNMAAILAMMQAQQAQTTAVLRALQGGTKPSLTFPTWDAQSSTKGLFIERLKTFQKDEYFAGATWTRKDPAFQKHSVWLRDAILKSLPEDFLASFKDRREFEDDGFAMFTHLLTELTPTSLDTLILDVIELGTLEMRPQESPKAFLARARRLMNSLEKVKNLTTHSSPRHVPPGSRYVSRHLS
jgi:hypothetical protein